MSRPGRLLARLLVGTVVLGVTGGVPAIVGTSSACAAGETRAVLVVDTGGRDARLCVALPGAEPVSGTGLLRLASSQYGLQYRLGFGGGAVCQIAGVGPDGGDCFGDYPDFWGYWRGDGRGGWTWSSTGAADTVVEPGDVEGWSWGTGQDAATHPQPPATTFDSACAARPSPGPSPGGGGGDGTNHGSDGSGGSHRHVGGGAPTPSSRPAAASASSAPGRSGAPRADAGAASHATHAPVAGSPSGSAPPASLSALAAASGGSGGGAALPGALAALCLAGALAIVGSVVARRRSRG